jgi:hypothetical protein
MGVVGTFVAFGTGTMVVTAAGSFVVLMGPALLVGSAAGWLPLAELIVALVVVFADGAKNGESKRTPSSPDIAST